MRLMDRRRALMAASGGDEANGFVPTASAGLGGSVASISSDGTFYIETFMSAKNNAIKADFKKPILFVAGDTIQVKAVRKSGSLSQRYSYVDISLNDTVVISNELLYGNANTAFNQSATITADITAEYMMIRGRTANQTGTNYSCEVQIFKNGERVI